MVLGKDMKVFLYDRPGKIKMSNTLKPVIGEQEILVKMKAYGISISDLMAYAKGWVNSLYHKMSGEIIETGKKVKGFDVGDHVFFNSYYHCMNCSACLKGYNNLCENRVYFLDPNIALAEYVKLPPELISVGGVIKAARGISFEEITHIGPLSNCINTLESLKICPDDNVAIIGAGYMGLLHLCLLKIYPVNKIIVCEVDEYRLKKAEEFGADHVLNPSKGDMVKEVKGLTNGGVDAVIVATASTQAMEQSLKITRSKGRISLFGGVGMTPFNASIKLDTYSVHYKELAIIGTYSSRVPDHHVAAANLISSRKLKLNGLNTHKVPFKHAPEALNIVNDPTALRVIISL